MRWREFPVTQKKIFLAHAGVCPLPRRVSAAMIEYLTAAQNGDQEEVFRDLRLLEIRQSAAKLIGALPEEIALVGPTSVGLSIIAAGIRIKPGENILIYFDDYPSNVYPWLNLRENGVEIRRLIAGELGRITAEDVLKQVDANTRLVALASCHFLSGWRICVDEIGRELRQKGIFFCVDAIQTLGAFPTIVNNVDFLAADAHKWLLGPCGAGILYIRKELQEFIKPVLLGWHNVRCPGFVAQDEIVFPTDARKYEAGTHPIALLAGLKASLDLIHEVGIDNISGELLRKRRKIVNMLEKLNAGIPNVSAPEQNQSAIVSFLIQENNTELLHKNLIQSGIITSLRQDRNGRKFIRISPHFYNTDMEILKLEETIGAVLNKH
ncbi:MAG: aminotransferase class V-fold PLP-dependent enzyme [Verrucomicrobiae bacterium]|nr:aminotransferase class V-fold PLP-dependent enzyme [Verrucomicrobiae bacterium]